MKIQRTWICVVVTALAIVVGAQSASHADPGVVVTRDGQTFEGEVIEEGDHVNVTIHGVTTVIPKTRVLALRYKPAGDYSAQFRARMARLDAKDVKGRIALARDAFDVHKYDLAREALAEAIKIDPNSKEAYDMLELILSQIRLERARAATTAAADGATTRPATRPSSPPANAGIERRLLSADEINTIRQAELKPTDAGVRVTFQGDVKRNYAKLQNMTFADFNRFSPAQQASAIIQHGTDEMRAQVRIASDPSAMADFKRNVQPLVVSGCASIACHGGPGGAGLSLFTPADADPLTYTNFYILQRYSKQLGAADGMFGGAIGRLIDRAHPNDSLLLNYGLPSNVAQFDHPQVGGKPINPIFRGKEDPRYVQVAKWVGESLNRLEPNYGIDYPIFGGGSGGAASTATAPSTAPAASTQPDQ